MLMQAPVSHASIANVETCWIFKWSLPEAQKSFKFKLHSCNSIHT